MSLTINRPRGLALAPAGRRPRAVGPRPSTRDALEHAIACGVKAVEAGRISICCGCHLIGWYPADALAEVLADLSRWAIDPSARDLLPWPRRTAPWEWRSGETLAVWHAGQVVALVTKPALGEPIVTRLDRAVAAE